MCNELTIKVEPIQNIFIFFNGTWSWWVTIVFSSKIYKIHNISLANKKYIKNCEPKILNLKFYGNDFG